MTRRNVQKNIILAVVLVGIALLVAIALTLQGPPGSNVQSDIKITDWISAIGSAIGAIGTAGALLLGVWVYRRQEEDQRRAQAAAITVTVTPIRSNAGVLEFKVRNDSQLPIYEVMLIASNLNGQDIEQVFTTALPPRDSSSFQLRSGPTDRCRCLFVDSGGRRWRRESTGQLDEITAKRGK